MRHYDIPYVANGPMNYYPATPLEDMSLDEIVKKYIKMCGKANGLVSVCSKCQTPCREGQRAIQLLANKVCDAKIPLYAGKTLIEKAQEQNKERRMQMENKVEEQKEVKKEPKKRRGVGVPYDGWYEDAVASGDAVEWLVDKMSITKTQAKKKLYQYRYLHGLTGKTKTEISDEKVNEVKSEVKTEPVNESVVQNSPIEVKLEALLKMQEKHKKAMDEYLHLYEEAKVEYEKIKNKTDILCSAMDILND